MNTDFNIIINRVNTNSIKHSFPHDFGKNEEHLALWVGDMDFKSPPGVIEALESRLEHGVFGYTKFDDGYFEALEHWFLDSFHWHPKPEWLVTTPGVIYAMAAAIRTFTIPGDAILIQRPLYGPFSTIVTQNHRILVNNPLIHDPDSGKYRIDFQDFENKIISNQVKCFILCNPHNPIGRVWTEAELNRLGEICLNHGVIVISDESHQDFAYPGHVHQVFANLCPEFSLITITCTAPSKTFNLAGLETANIFIENTYLRQSFINEMKKQCVNHPNLMGMIACEAAYKTGGAWLAELKIYLKGNINFLNNFFCEKLPEIKLVEPEGTFLAWLDLRNLNLTPSEQMSLIMNKAKLWLEPGITFGPEGMGYERMNIACSQSVLEEACMRLEKALRQ